MVTAHLCLDGSGHIRVKPVTLPSDRTAAALYRRKAFSVALHNSSRVRWMSDLGPLYPLSQISGNNE